MPALPMYNVKRLGVILFMMGANAILALVEVTARRFPMGIGAILCLMPCLLRELDLKKGLPPRKMGSLEWSYILAGVLWVWGVYPLFLL